MLRGSASVDRQVTCPDSRVLTRLRAPATSSPRMEPTQRRVYGHTLLSSPLTSAPHPYPPRPGLSSTEPRYGRRALSTKQKIEHSTRRAPGCMNWRLCAQKNWNTMTIWETTPRGSVRGLQVVVKRRRWAPGKPGRHACDRPRLELQRHRQMTKDRMCFTNRLANDKNMFSQTV